MNNSIESLCFAFDYETNLIECMMSEDKLYAELIKSECLDESVRISLNESFISKIKEWIRKLGELWANFTKKCSDAFKKIALPNAKWLEESKEQIMVSSPKATITVYPYYKQKALFAKTTFPSWDKNKFEQMDSKSFITDLIDKYYPDYKITEDSGSFAEVVAETLRGSKEPLKFVDDQIDIPAIYEFTKSAYDTYIGEINKTIATMSNQFTIAYNQCPSEKPASSTPEKPKNEATLLEFKRNKNKKAKDAPKNGEISTNNEPSGSNDNENKTDKVSSTLDDLIGNKNTAEADELTKYRDMISGWNKVCKDYLNTKLNITNEACNVYIKLLKTLYGKKNTNVSKDEKEIDKNEKEKVEEDIRKEKEKYDKAKDPNEKAKHRISIFNIFKKISNKNKATDATNKLLGK